MNEFQQDFENFGIDLISDNNMSELCDLLFDKFRLLKSKNEDLKRYIIDTDKYGIDSDTIKSRVEQYKQDLK